jgi:ATP-dependent DNA helicase MPH1
MIHSDEFGIDDDDTAWLDAATQLEASQAVFHPSPRPSKRRKTSPTADESDVESDDSYYLPGELERVDVAKNSKHKIHVHEGQGDFADVVVTQTQHDLDDDPTAIRGPIWKRPAPLSVLARAQNNALLRQAHTLNSAKPLNNGIKNFLQAKSSTVLRAEPENDASVAARLQEEENQRFRHGQLHTPVSRPPSFSVVDLSEDLADLPPGAFSSSASEQPAVIEIASRTITGHNQIRNAGVALRGPQTGLKQTTLNGQMATQDITASQAAKKRHAWPLKTKEEPPTHHKIDTKAMETWVYPTNLGTVRDYQFNIVARSLFHNTLVALPTGLGKTFIAATVMLNYYRWTTSAQIVFMAPTKPLIAQQMEACYGIVGIPRRDTVLMTGETAPGRRTDEWLERRVFFMTPQTVINDLKTGICDPKRLVLLVVDEAHKATGAFAYTEVVSFVRRFNPSFRVLALTATPGSTVETVQAVLDNLGIARVELRTEQSIDIRPYTHEKQTDIEVFDYSDEQGRIMELFTKALRDTVNKLKSHNAYFQGDPMQLTAFGLTMARKKWMATDAGRKAPKPIQGMINAAFQQLSKLAHGIGLLKNHGIKPFYVNVHEYQKSVQSGQEKGKTASAIVNSESFTTMMNTVRTWTSNPDFIGHPKLEYLREVVLNHFLDAGEGRQGSDVPPSATRIMIFASYRDSTEEICRVLKRNEPMIRPHVFVGQAASNGSEGMDQKRQNAVIQDFKSGKYNTLVATSIGEEGLDIGTVDLIICYDSSSSPIRMLQRIGRTGRKRLGRVVLLLMKGKEENDYAKSQDNYLWIQKTIADTSRYTFHDEQSPRILPKDAKPTVDKRPVEIPVENSQPVDLNEKGKRGKGKTKRPPKKFHMPDGVRTTFVRASKLNSDDDSEEGIDVNSNVPATTKARLSKSTSTLKNARPISPKPEPAPLPFMGDVLLSSIQLDDWRQKYAQTLHNDKDDTIHVPGLSNSTSQLRRLGQTKFIPHRRAIIVQRMMLSIQAIDDDRVDRMHDILDSSLLESSGAANYRLCDPDSTTNGKIIAQASSAGIRTELPSGRPTTKIDAQKTAPKAATKAAPKVAPKVARKAAPKAASKAASKATSKASAVKPIRPPKAQATAASENAQTARGRPRKAASPRPLVTYLSSAQEGDESSPEPTPADMRIGTQGIDLGSRDTSGEDNDEDDSDSELDGFIAKSSDPIEMASSSQDGLPRRRKHMGLKRKVAPARSALSDVEEIDSANSCSDASGAELPVVSKGKKKRIVEDSESDE